MTTNQEGVGTTKRQISKKNKGLILTLKELKNKTEIVKNKVYKTSRH